MKHLLLGTTAMVLGTTALAGAGLVVGGAYATVKLELGGRYYGAYGSHFDTQDDHPGNVEDADLDRGDVVKQDIEVHFGGEMILDNGLTVGARTELEGQFSDEQIGAAFAYASGGFGEFRIGDTADALAQLCYLAPSATRIGDAGAMFGADSPIFVFHNTAAAGGGALLAGGTVAPATNGTCYGISGDASKLIYFSPTFAGFHFAVSYAPDGTEDTRNTSGGFGTRSDSSRAFQDSEIWSVAATFEQDFNGVSVVLGGGAAWSQDVEGDGFFVDESGLSTRREYNAYAQLGFGLGDGTLTIGGAWALRTNMRDRLATALGGDGLTHVSGVNDDNDDEVFSVGVAYAIDAWTIGASASWGEYESSCPAACVTDSSDNHNAYVIDVAYALGPGIGVGAMVGYDEYRPGDGASVVKYEAVTAGVGLYVAF